MSSGISCLLKEEPQKVPPRRLWAVHDLEVKECLASVWLLSILRAVLWLDCILLVDCNSEVIAE